MTTTDTTTIEGLIDLVRELTADRVADHARIERLETAIVEGIRETTGFIGQVPMWNRCPARLAITTLIQGPPEPFN